jgi:hypothetical protein
MRAKKITGPYVLRLKRIFIPEMKPGFMLPTP